MTDYVRDMLHLALVWSAFVLWAIERARVTSLWIEIHRLRSLVARDSNQYPTNAKSRGDESVDNKHLKRLVYVRIVRQRLHYLAKGIHSSFTYQQVIGKCTKSNKATNPFHSTATVDGSNHTAIPSASQEVKCDGHNEEATGEDSQQSRTDGE